MWGWGRGVFWGTAWHRTAVHLCSPTRGAQPSFRKNDQTKHDPSRSWREWSPEVIERGSIIPRMENAGVHRMAAVIKSVGGQMASDPATTVAELNS